MFDARLDVTEPLGEAALAQVPAKRGVFCLLAADDAPIVLLTAADIRSRLRARLAERDPAQRTRTADLREITRAIVWRLSTSNFETDLHYIELARSIWPDTYTEMLAWRRPWFVHVNPAGPHPHFERTRDVLAQAGTYIGPFPDGQLADRFVEMLQDAFGLCRHLKCLRMAPHAPPCAYAQMHKCASVCDGTMPLAQYGELAARARDFAAGLRAPLADELRAQMKTAATELMFERAAALKTQLERLAEFDKPLFAQALPAERFQFIAVQSGAGSRQAKAFLCDRGQIVEAPPLDYPPRPDQLRALLDAMAAMTSAGPRDDLTARQWRMGLVASYLFSGQHKRGVIVRWQPDYSPEALAAEIERSADVLHLKTPNTKRQTPNTEPKTPDSKLQTPNT